MEISRSTVVEFPKSEVESFDFLIDGFVSHIIEVLTLPLYLQNSKDGDDDDDDNVRYINNNYYIQGCSNA